MDNTVAIAAIGLAGTAIGGVIWVVRYLANTLSIDLREHTKAATELKHAAREQTKASNEVLTFMKKLNGKLEGAVIQKVAEQNVTEQTVEHQTVKIKE